MRFWKCQKFLNVFHRSNIAQTLKFTKTNNHFYSFTYEKNIFSSSSYQWVDFLWICWQTEKLWIQHQNILCLLKIQTRLLFFLQWGNSTKWSTKLPYQEGPNVENFSFYLFHQLWKVGQFSLEQHSKSQFSIFV